MTAKKNTWGSRSVSGKKKELSKKAKDVRAKNITKYNKDVASGCVSSPNLTHGGYSKQIRRRYSDKRTTEGKALAMVMSNLQADLGNLSTGQGILLDRVKEKLVTLWQIGNFVDQQSTLINPAGELIPCLGRNYLAFAESLRRDIETLYSSANKRPAKVKTIPEIIAEIEAEKKANEHN